MPVSGIDHVNIVTDDLDGTARFYEAALGLTRSANDGIAAGFRGAWMRDEQGDAIVHLVWRDPDAERYRGHEPGQSTNAVHHVAFRCTGFDATLARLAAAGLDHRVNDRQVAGLRQIFVTDPNAVLLELNFPDD